ncbi:DUF2975 domain-containing protein [Flavobacterium sp.]|uniref:DUF2975 domain-containing protein n=1 Tax=Flavobacterium sp. TaxID=239 RepID=UPI002D181C53|nr:DUF2975 domain-containing protein [Flavobacterium sp.]HSD06890.1 DUF2975 domain-containing protein [Flavobacterium sp.]
MKRISTLLLQTVVIIIGIVALAVLIRFPLSEGRAKNLELLSIYSDPFILYGYATSIAFFIGLYKTFQLLGYVRQNKTFSIDSLKALKNIKYCATVLSILVVGAGIFIKLTHNKEDDPVGFLVICTVVILACILVVFAVSKFEKKLQNALDKNQI